MKRWPRNVAKVLGSTLALATAVSLVSWWLVPPVIDDGSQTAISLRIEDRQGQALLRQVGVDEQWREPIVLESIAICHCRHGGGRRTVPDALGRRPHRHHACRFQIRHAEVVWASTLTMQVCKMLDPAPDLRTKWIEAIRALKYERDHQRMKYLNSG